MRNCQPGWPVIEQVPAAIGVTVTPATTHTAGVPETNVTANPELAVALSEGTTEPSV